jgi:hypothetical protein
MRTFRSLTGPIAGLLVLAALLVTPLPAAAGWTKAFHENYSNDVDILDFCGFHITGVDEGVVNFFFTPVDGAPPRVKITGNSTSTYTNVDNGKQVIISSAGQYRIISEVDNGAGYTLSVVNTGMPEKISTGDGQVLVKDVGLLGRVIYVDYDLNFVSQEVVFEAGPHPDADSDFQLYCRAITSALS